MQPDTHPTLPDDATPPPRTAPAMSGEDRVLEVLERIADNLDDIVRRVDMIEAGALELRTEVAPFLDAVSHLPFVKKALRKAGP